jgi:hypothetical protein
MSVEWFAIFLAVGKLLMFLARKSPYFKRGDFLSALFSCELCLGVWVYSAMSFVYQFYLFDGVRYVPFLSEFITGSIMSFVMWLITDGWNSNFREMHINME